MRYLSRHSSQKAFTLIELLIVATIMIMVAGIIYTFYVNLSRSYHRGSDTVIRVLDAQNTLELISKDLRSARNINKLSKDHIEFQRYYYESDENKNDPVADLNKLIVQRVEIRVVKDDAGYYGFERRVGVATWEKLASQFRSKYLVSDVFQAWRLNQNFYEVYDPDRSSPDRIPLIKISINIASPDNPVHLFKKVFLPVPYGELPIIKLPESAQNP